MQRKRYIQSERQPERHPRRRNAQIDRFKYVGIDRLGIARQMKDTKRRHKEMRGRQLKQVQIYPYKDKSITYLEEYLISI